MSKPKETLAVKPECQELYSLRDRATDIFGTPMGVPTQAVIERELKNMLANTDTLMSRNPSDFDLYFLGTYDTTSGLITPADSPRLVANVGSYKSAN